MLAATITTGMYVEKWNFSESMINTGIFICYLDLSRKPGLQTPFKSGYQVRMVLHQVYNGMETGYPFSRPRCWASRKKDRDCLVAWYTVITLRFEPVYRYIQRQMILSGT